MHRLCASLIVIVLSACTPTSSDRPATEPSADARAAYDVFPHTVRFGVTPKATLKNEGRVPLEYERGFELEMSFDGRWQTLQRPPGQEGECDFPLRNLVLHPGDSETQEIEACTGQGEVEVLVPGNYRVSKTVRTIPSDPDADAQEITKVAEFAVAEASADIPGPSDCVVLCMSDTRVRGGDKVRVSFDPPPRYGWGVPSEIHLGTAKTVTPIALLTAWQDDEELITWFPGEGGGYEDIGFRGSARWDWVIPRRLDPGIYSIVKEGIKGNFGPQQRFRTWVVSFEVTE